MFNENYKWNYDYVRLACDSGFSFDKHKTDDFDKNKISLIDIDRIIREKDVSTVEKFIPLVTQFVLDPEQAQILDDNFVKIFRVGQLSVEYLLFCKKYLDNSLERVKEDFVKLREENKELNFFVEELKEHISALMKEIKEKNKVAQYKCEHCNKIFSSEEFLNSHIKRRHSTQTNPPIEVETDKLHLEIKELKGRLNSAEKMIQKDQMNLQPVHEKESANESKKIDELQQKFEELRLQVQSELKVLQTQHNFQDKYEKLFEKMALQSTRGQDKGGGDLLKRRESTTQTDIEPSPKKSEVQKVDVKNKENIPEVDNAQKITEFGEALETKVTSSLQKIESQMQSFWNKLNDMEIHKKDSSQEVEESPAPPLVKPRSKYTMTSPPVEEKKKSEDKSPKRKLLKKEERVQVIKAIVTKPQSKDVTIPQPTQRKIVTPNLSLDEDDSSKASRSEITSDSEIAPVKSPPRPISAKRRKPLPKAEKLVVDDELFQYFKEEVEKIVIMGRLQDLGVSPEWKGLPTRSFNRALEIVNHQATLMKKTHPDFDLLSANLEKEVVKKVKETMLKKKSEKKVVKERTPKGEVKKNSNPASVRGVASPQIEIKNRKMYETDSDSEAVKVSKVKENLKQFSAPYTAVIEELKSVTTKLEVSDSSLREEEIMKNEDQTKGVLKNYPSVGSLTKKKVLFNLDNEHKIPDNRDSGSTTSVASSVLDGTPRKNHKIDKDKDIEDLSDFDFSDM